MKLLLDIAAEIERGDSAALKESIRTALSMRLGAETILNEGLMKGMDVLGRKFKRNEVFIPEVLIAARAMRAGLDILRPHLTESPSPFKIKIVIGTVRGDLHEIGKNIVAMILEKEGFHVVDLGVDVPKEKFVSAIKKERPHIVGLSALLTTTMVYMSDVIEAIENAKLRRRIKVIVGGGPVTASFAYGIRADGYAPDAFSAVDLVKKLIENKIQKGPSRELES